MFHAARANIIHSFDGYLVRRITLRLGYPIITIHDSFGIDILNTPLLITIMQEELSQLTQIGLFLPTTSISTPITVDSEFVIL